MRRTRSTAACQRLIAGSPAARARQQAAEGHAPLATARGLGQADSVMADLKGESEKYINLRISRSGMLE
jgi:hypothetical protein